jgi:hypothetical protein
VSDAPPKNSGSVQALLSGAVAAESLVRRGATEPALILYEELVRASGGSGADELGTLLAPTERLERARRTLRSVLHDELKSELEWARNVRVQVKRLVVAVAAFGVLLLAPLLMLSPTEVSKGAHWTASSAYDRGPTSGELPQRRLFYSAPMYFFHTLAEHEPWLQIDLARERVVSSVRITNRLDCCRERARDIVVELGIDAGTFSHSRRHPKEDKDFREWDVRFPPTRARFVRIRGTRDESLHLADVRIFGS